MTIKQCPQCQNHGFTQQPYGWKCAFCGYAPIGKYSTEQEVKSAARKDAPSLNWGQNVTVIQYPDKSYSWIVESGSSALSGDAVRIAYFSRISRRWSQYS
jgi:hypothetical protein